jgi:hypothetical protein
VKARIVNTDDGDDSLVCSVYVCLLHPCNCTLFHGITVQWSPGRTASGFVLAPSVEPTPKMSVCICFVRLSSTRPLSPRCLHGMVAALRF